MINKILKNVRNLNLMEILVIIGPFVDLITSLCIRFFSVDVSLGMIVKSLFLAYMLFYLFFKSDYKYKKISIVYLTIIAVYMIIFFANMISIKGASVLFAELKIVVKTFYFPVVLVTLINFMGTKKQFVSNKVIITSLLIYITLILIPSITGTQFDSYTNDKKGNIGWFYAANEIGTILAILLPILLFYYNKIKIKLWYYISIFLVFFIMLQMGTKVPMLGIAITTIGYLVVQILKYILNKDKDSLKRLLAPGLIIVMFFGITLFISPIASNLRIQIAGLMDVKEEGNTELNKKDIENLIYSSRNQYRTQVREFVKDAPVASKVFGIGNVNNVEDKMFLCEMDFYDIFYNYGIAGFVVYFMPIGYMIIIIIKRRYREIQASITSNNTTSNMIAIAVSFGCAYYSGHTLVAPSVSIFIALILSMFFIDSIENREEE